MPYVPIFADDVDLATLARNLLHMQLKVCVWWECVDEMYVRMRRTECSIISTSASARVRIAYIYIIGSKVVGKYLNCLELHEKQ